MLNRWIGMGRLVDDPVLRRTGSGVPVTTFTIAVEHDWKDSEGVRGTDFLDIVAWRNTAEFVCRYFFKGKMAVIEGRLQIRHYQDKEGIRRRASEIVAENVYFGDNKRTAGGERGEGTDECSPDGKAAAGSGTAVRAARGEYQAPAKTVWFEMEDDGLLPF